MVQLAERTRRRQPTCDTPTSSHRSAKPSRLPISPLAMRSPLAQPKLKVNPPGDKYEQEADAVAKSVMQSPAPLPQPDENRAQVTGVQRATEEDEAVQREPAPEEAVQRKASCSACKENSKEKDEKDTIQRRAEEEEAVQRMESDDDTLQRQPAEADETTEETEDATAADTLQRQAAADTEDTGDEGALQRKGIGIPRVSLATGARIRSPGLGSPLPASMRRRIEPHLGVNLSGVRVHTNFNAHQATASLNARAFTHRNNIFLNRSESSYNLGLIAHEATHVAQQGAAPVQIQSDKSDIEAPTDRPTRTDVSEAPTPQAEATPPVASETETSANQPPASPADAAPPPPADTATAAVKPLPLPTESTPPKTAQAAVSVVAAVPLEGASDQALQQVFSASPSKIATTYAQLGATLTQKLGKEQQTEAEKAPVLVAETTGEKTLSLAPVQTPTPTTTEIKEKDVGPEPPKVAMKPHENRASPPSNKTTEALLNRPKQGGFLSWWRSNSKHVINRIPTKDPGLNINAGIAPSVELTGKADPKRLDQLQLVANAKLKDQRDRKIQAFKTHPGQRRIQPKAMKAEQRVNLSTEGVGEIGTPVVPAMLDYANAPYPKEIRDKADEALQLTLEQGLQGVKTQVFNGAKEKKINEINAVAQANDQANRINHEANHQQCAIVTKNRQLVAQQQGEGIKAAYAMMQTFDQETNQEQINTRKGVEKKVNQAKTNANAELAKGEEKARQQQQKAEKEANAQKLALQRQQGGWKNQPVKLAMLSRDTISRQTGPDPQAASSGFVSNLINRIKGAVQKAIRSIDAIFKRLRAAVKSIIERAKQAAFKWINDARVWVVNKLNQFRDWVQKKVDTLLKEHLPALVKRISGAINGIVQVAVKGVRVIVNGAIAGVKAVAKGLGTALHKGLKFYQSVIKTSVQLAGAFLTKGFAGGLRLFVQKACELAGIDPKPILEFIDRAGQFAAKILKHVVKFFNNLVLAVKGGVLNFVKNIKAHLIKGLVGWLTGALSALPIQLPKQLDAMGVFSLVAQLLGATYDNIKAVVIKRFPPAGKIFDVIEKSIAIIGKLRKEGPMAMWKTAQQKVTDLRKIVVDAIRNFFITKVLQEGITWLMGFLTGAGAIVKVVQLLLRFVQFLVGNYQQIKEFVLSVYTAITTIAAGNLPKAEKKVEDAMGNSLPVLIGLLATLAGLGGIGEKVKQVIGKVTQPITKVVRAIIRRIIDFAKKRIKKGKAALKKLLGWWKKKKPFKTKDGKSHMLSFKLKGKTNPVPMISSTPMTVTQQLSKWEKVQPQPKEAGPLLSNAKKLNNELDAQPSGAKGGKKADKGQADKLSKQTDVKLGQLAKVMVKLFGIIGEEDIKGAKKAFLEEMRRTDKTKKKGLSRSEIIKLSQKLTKEYRLKTIKFEIVDKTVGVAKLLIGKQNGEIIRMGTVLPIQASAGVKGRLTACSGVEDIKDQDPPWPPRTTPGEKISPLMAKIVSPQIACRLRNVQIHRASPLPANFDAIAITIGTHIYFSPGAYTEETREGRHLILHELVHTLQQGASSGPNADGSYATRPILTVDQGLEREADYLAEYFEAINAGTCPPPMANMTPKRKTANTVQRYTGNPVRVHYLTARESQAAVRVRFESTIASLNNRACWPTFSHRTNLAYPLEPCRHKLFNAEPGYHSEELLVDDDKFDPSCSVYSELIPCSGEYLEKNCNAMLRSRLSSDARVFYSFGTSDARSKCYTAVTSELKSYLTIYTVLEGRGPLNPARGRYYGRWIAAHSDLVNQQCRQ
ncbi:MAG: DUF4157 domain-containing protein [Leptolyngbyaceae cyanobacterium MO_188.B28]|nr:DUF4157 domain-containing protein [Leptolyngbyaceae cyanobacterium MO_188.B28]